MPIIPVLRYRGWGWDRRKVKVILIYLNLRPAGPTWNPVSKDKGKLVSINSTYYCCALTVGKSVAVRIHWDEWSLILKCHGFHWKSTGFTFDGRKCSVHAQEQLVLHTLSYRYFLVYCFDTHRIELSLLTFWSLGSRWLQPTKVAFVSYI